MTSEGNVRKWLAEAARTIEAMDPKDVSEAAEALTVTRERGGTIFVAGNGGSASTASHLALDLQKAARSPAGRGTRAVALTDNLGLITAWANDTDYDRVFAEQLDVLARPGDALIVISVSGSSPNLIAALETARGIGMLTVGLLGGEGGRAASLVDHAVVVPSRDYGWVEAAHVVLHHVLTYALRDAAAASDLTPQRPRARP